MGTAPKIIEIHSQFTVLGRDDVIHTLRPLLSDGKTTKLTNGANLEFDFKDEGKRFKIGRKPISAKRGGIVALPDIAVTEPKGVRTVSREHLQIRYGFYPNSTTVKCTGSNGAFVNMRRIPNNTDVVLPEGATLSLSSAPDHAADADLTSYDQATVNFKFRKTVRERPVAEGTTYAGVRDVQMQVSRFHCKLIYHEQSNTFKIMDLGSVNGIFVDRMKIANGVKTSISLGAEIVLGGYPSHYGVGSRLKKIKPFVYAFRLESY
jgi:pSer/pThr/pTyr-binding forkhead associated (FHA) protein